MKSVNYYMRDERNHPFAAITVIESEGSEVNYEEDV